MGSSPPVDRFSNYFFIFLFLSQCNARPVDFSDIAMLCNRLDNCC